MRHLRNDETPNDVAIELRIEELVLNGFAPSDRHHIGEAIERELVRLISTNGLAGVNKTVSISRFEGGTFTADIGVPLRTLGEHVANQVFQQVASMGQAPDSRTPT